MITSWRIVKDKHRHIAFSGEGARIYGGRWNPVGVPAISTAESLSLATLEILVHLENEQLLYQRFVKIPVSFDPSLIYSISRKDLPPDWNCLPPSESTQTIGLKWIRQAKHAILKVPSTVTSEEHNYIINPNHSDFTKIIIGKPKKFEFDARLIEKHTQTPNERKK